MEKKLTELREELADLEKERTYMLSKTNIHVPGSAAGKYNEEIEKIKEKIREIEDRLQV